MQVLGMMPAPSADYRGKEQSAQLAPGRAAKIVLDPS